MFDPNTEALGPSSSYRCTEHGVICSPDTPRAPGAYQSCRQREGSRYMFGLDEYVDFIRDLKGGRPMVFVAAIAGPGGNRDASVSLGETSNLLQLGPACFDGDGVAAPAFRVNTFAGAFGLDTGLSSICEPSFAPTLGRLGQVLVSAAGGRCLVARPDPDTCVVTAGESEIPACPQAPGQPCFQLIDDSPGCETGPEVAIEWAGQAPLEALAIRCARM